MAVRRFGPIRGAGTRVEEKEGEKTITPGAFGFAGYAAAFQKGPVGAMTIITSPTDFAKFYGGIFDGTLGPDAAQDYFSLANGAGGIACLRVTDGTEVASSLPVYARNSDANVPVGTIKAKNGGRWGGRESLLVNDLDLIGDLTNTTLQLPAAIAADLSTDELKDGFIELDAVSNTRYPIIGNTNTGLVTVAPDQTMLDDHVAAAAPTNLRFIAVVEDSGSNLAVRFGDGEEDSASEFSIEVFLDGVSVKKFGNLRTDPAHARYWVDIVNNDDDNQYIEAEDLFAGFHTAASRPANAYDEILTATATKLTLKVHTSVFNDVSGGGGDPTIALGATTEDMVAQKLTVTFTAATAYDVVSDKFGALGSGATGVEFVTAAPTFNKFVPPFTVTAGGSPAAATDEFVLEYKPLAPNDQLVGGRVYPNKGDNPLDQFRIVSNTHNTVDVPGGLDLTTLTSAGKKAMISAAIRLTGGVDGIADLSDAEYSAAWDTDSSPFNDIEGQNLGVIKFATPGITSTSVQKDGWAYAEAKNHQYRTEIPVNITTENGALDYINNTIGRSDYETVFWPSYGDVLDPDPAAAREGKRKTVSLTGMCHGREARIAADYDGHHKAQAGVDAFLPRLLSIPTGDRKLDEERLNPNGINVIKKKSGSYVMWGDRNVHRDSNWKFKHQREQMSYYEHVLSENFDFIIFAINDASSDTTAETALTSFFFPEFVKRALRGDSFDEAAIIKVDSEINTDSTRANGDKFAEVSLQLADTVERFIIRIGKQGVSEDVSS